MARGEVPVAAAQGDTKEVDHQEMGFVAKARDYKERTQRSWVNSVILVGIVVVTVGFLSTKRTFENVTPSFPKALDHYEGPPRALAVAVMDFGERKKVVSPLEAVMKREEFQSASHGKGIDAALQMHAMAGVRKRLAMKRMSAAEKQQLSAVAARPDLNGDYKDHPWDLINPEGMPMSGGRMESAAKMVALAGESTSVPTAEAKTLVADVVMAGGGTLDPRAMLDLSEGIQEHEGMRGNAHHRPQRRSEQQEDEQEISLPRAVMTDAQRAEALPSSGLRGQTQGFEAGDHLKVSASEYHHEMRRYMPSSSGRLISPFEWFTEAGRPAVLPKKQN